MDHQFTEDEAREVFARAAERQHEVRSKGEGLSLDELRAIGREAGLDPEHIEAAARAVATGEPETGRTGLGPLPSGVFRTVVLPGPPTGALWDHVVADARRTFSAQGTVSDSGRIREWRNGNLRVTLESEGTGASRLHLQTRRRERARMSIGAGVVGVFALLSAVLGSIDLLADGGDMWSVLLLGLGMLLGALGLGAEQRRWATVREEQFADVARRAAEVVEAPLPTARQREASPRLDLDALPDLNESAGPASSRPRTRS